MFYLYFSTTFLNGCQIQSVLGLPLLTGWEDSYLSHAELLGSIQSLGIVGKLTDGGICGTKKPHKPEFHLFAGITSLGNSIQIHV